MLSETQLGRGSSSSWIAVQKSAGCVVVQHLPSGAVFVIETTFRCKGVTVLGSTLVVRPQSAGFVESYCVQRSDRLFTLSYLDRIRTARW